MILTVCPNPSVDTYAWLDHFEPGSVNRILRLEEYPGGKGIHVAMAIKTLGGDVTVLGSWAGATGDWLQERCQEAGIGTHGILLEGSNRKCYTFRSEKAPLNNTELLEPGPHLDSAGYARFMAEFADQVLQAELVCMSGSWPQGAPIYAYAEAIDIATRHDKKIIIDCSGKQLEVALEKSFFGIHLNEDEAKSLFHTENVEQIIATLHKKIKLVAITKGKEGMWLSYDGCLMHANVLIESVLSTVGSGDCLTAGIAYAINEGLSIEEVARYGVACGAANCIYEPIGILRKSDVEALLPLASLKTLIHDN